MGGGRQGRGARSWGQVPRRWGAGPRGLWLRGEKLASAAAGRRVWGRLTHLTRHQTGSGVASAPGGRRGEGDGSKRAHLWHSSPGASFLHTPLACRGCVAGTRGAAAAPGRGQQDSSAGSFDLFASPGRRSRGAVRKLLTGLKTHPFNVLETPSQEPVACRASSWGRDPRPHLSGPLLGFSSRKASDSCPGTVREQREWKRPVLPCGASPSAHRPQSAPTSPPPPPHPWLEELVCRLLEWICR